VSSAGLNFHALASSTSSCGRNGVAFYCIDLFSQKQSPRASKFLKSERSISARKCPVAGDYPLLLLFQETNPRMFIIKKMMFPMPIPKLFIKKRPKKTHKALAIEKLIKPSLFLLPNK
jgi:hypothetical protein